MSDDPREPRRKFNTTRWSVVLKAGATANEGDESRQALSQLIETYWYPLYAFSRRQGASDHDAMDLTQGFLTHLVSGGGLSSVSPEKGRFRSFLLAAFKNFIANQRRASEAIRRGGAVDTVSLHAAEFESRYHLEPADQETPERLFQRSWVEELLARVRSLLAEEYRLAGKTQIFTLLEPHLTHATDAIPRAEIGQQLGLSSAAIAMSIHRMRRRYGELLRQEVAATLDDPADIEDELRDLMSIIGRGA